MVQLPGVTARPRDIYGRTATLEVRTPVERRIATNPATGKPSRACCRPAPSCSEPRRSKAAAAVSARVIFSGDDRHADFASIDQQHSGSVVSVTLDG